MNQNWNIVNWNLGNKVKKILKRHAYILIKKMRLKRSSAKCCTFGLGLNVVFSIVVLIDSSEISVGLICEYNPVMNYPFTQSPASPCNLAIVAEWPMHVHHGISLSWWIFCNSILGLKWYRTTLMGFYVVLCGPDVSTRNVVQSFNSKSKLLPTTTMHGTSMTLVIISLLSR